MKFEDHVLAVWLGLVYCFAVAIIVVLALYLPIAFVGLLVAYCVGRIVLSLWERRSKYDEEQS